MRYGILISLLFVAHTVHAVCPYPKSMLESLPPEQVVHIYEGCAVSSNDDDSQIKLARWYEKGENGVPKNIKKALYYYQLSADNGNAEAQTRLAYFYQQYDQSKEGRAVLKDYSSSLFKGWNLSLGSESGFQGEFLHPYALLVLANEKPENKWYYLTNTLTPPDYARSLLKAYKLTDEKKKQLTRQATAWKKRKLLEMARQILPKDEYQSFVSTVYPTKEKADAFKRSQLLKEFRKKVEDRKKQDAEVAKIIY